MFMLIRTRQRLVSAAAACMLATLVAACASVPPGNAWTSGTVGYAAIVSSPLRTDADRRMDARRHPGEFLQFAGVKPGMRVLDVSAGAGYTSALLALAVGPAGQVWAQVDKPRPALVARLQAHPQPNLIPVIRPFSDPVPPQAPPLDLVTLILNYHDIANLPVDRVAMDRKLFEALRPGGHLVMIDHVARPGSGVADTKTLHRIDPAVVLEEVQRAGFRLEQSSNFLRNPADPHNRRSSDPSIISDKFAFRFVKP